MSKSIVSKVNKYETDPELCKHNLLDACNQYDFMKKGYMPLLNFVALAKKHGVFLTNVLNNKNQYSQYM